LERCPECNATLMVSNSRFESDGGSTEVYNVLTLVCTNPKCGSFCGKDLNNPLKIVKELRRKVN